MEAAPAGFREKEGAKAPAVFDYDANGNTISESNLIYTYDLSDQLIKVWDGVNLLAEYVYNADGQRIKKILSTETRVFHYDLQGHLIAETDQSGQMLAEYVYLGDQILTVIKPGESVYYFHNDHLETPQVLTDETQTVAWKAIYTAFGEANITTETVENPFRFPGQYYDQETGLHYNYFRYYDSTTGRYVTPDPIGLKGGGNLFAYVGNRPMNFADPFGLANKEPPVIRNPEPDEPPIVRNPPPNPKPRDYPPPYVWPPPFPRSFCEMRCYAFLFADYLTCNVYWHWEYLQDDPHSTCEEEERRHNKECKQDAYNKYRRCLNSCTR